jgi:hypothetical protein
VVDAEPDLAAHLLQLGARGPPGDDLVLTHMEQRSEAFRLVGSGIDRDDRDARGGRLLDRGAEGGRIGDRHHETGQLLVDGSVDELAHRDHVEGLGRPVLDLHVHVLAGGSDAVLDDRPERVVGLAVRHDDDADRLLGRGRGPQGDSCGGGETRDQSPHGGSSRALCLVSLADTRPMVQLIGPDCNEVLLRAGGCAPPGGR